MYLSRLILNARDRAVRHDLADCQALHRRLLAAFPVIENAGPMARAHFGVLYRVDESVTGAVQVLLQSRESPDWSSLPASYLVTAHGELQNPATKSIDDFYEALTNGLALRFRLRANPTRKIDTRSGSDGHRRNGKRVELRGEERWLEWLRRKGEQHGFAVRESRVRPDVPDVQAIEGDKAVGWRSGTDGRQRVTLASVVFNGRLLITDAARFRHALEAGVGSGKAYGFGLLSVARVG